MKTVHVNEISIYHFQDYLRIKTAFSRPAQKNSFPIQDIFNRQLPEKFSKRELGGVQPAATG